MNELSISISSLVLGIAATVLVSRYYFRRSVSKSLTPYIQFTSSPLKGIDPTVRDALDVRYEDKPVNELHEVQFLIANTGDKAIRDIIEPLTLKIPKGTELLDASLLHISPNGRHIGLHLPNDRRFVQFDIPLLNSGDFFIVKFLFNGEPSSSELEYSITAEDLPPTLTSEHLPADAIGITSKRSFEFSALGLGLGLLAIGSGLGRLIYLSWISLPDRNSSPYIEYVQEYWLDLITLIAGVIPTFLFILLGVIATVISLSSGSFPPSKTKFVVPNDSNLLRVHSPLVVDDIANVRHVAGRPPRH